MKIKQVVGMSLAASVATVAVVVMTLSVTANAEPSYVRLHMATNGQRFSLGNQTQELAPSRNNCALKDPVTGSPAALIKLTATSGSPKGEPGIADYGLGVRASASSGNGSPCAQIDSLESLTLSPGAALGNRTFKSVRLDLQMTGDAVAVVTLTGPGDSATFRLQTGTSIVPPVAPPSDPSDPDPSVYPYSIVSRSGDAVRACAAKNSSGPNSAGSDNCQWLIKPGFNFTTVEIKTESVGTVSLEGGGDFGTGPEYDTLFELSNAAPVANNDTVAAVEDTTLVGGFNVLTNDTDTDGTPANLIVTPTSALPPGVAQVGTTGQFNFSPPLNSNGPVSFTYTASDGTDTSNTATVTINVAAVNDPPAPKSSNPSTNEETAITIDVADDVDSTVIEADCSVDPTSAGTVTDLKTGSVIFTPALNFVGVATLTCTVKDDLGATNTAVATVNVDVNNTNDAPVANPDSDEVNQNRDDIDTEQFVDVVVLGNDTDVDGPSLSVGAITTQPLHGTAVPQPDGTVRYTPTEDYFGPDSFEYTASDGGTPNLSSSPAKVTIDVVPVMCSGDTVSDSDGDVSASFFRLTDEVSCKRYTIQADDANDSVLFQPTAVVPGEDDVFYRGVIVLGPKPAPTGNAGLTLLLEYDPELDGSFKTVQMCDSPFFDPAGVVTSATLPGSESWCVASETTVGSGANSIITTWQVYGEDDPRFQ